MSKGLTDAGWTCAGYVEMDKYAHQSFEILHDPEKKLWSGYDVRDVSDGSIRELGERTGGVRLLTGGFPCQSFSIAGKRAGFTDLTRGTLFFEIVRFATILKPKNLLLENVTGLLSHDSGGTFETILGSLDEMGYDCEWQVHNSAAYVPQNRERIFIVGHLRGISTRKVFPFGRENSKTIDVVGRIECKGDDYIKRVYGVGGLSPALPTMQGGGQEPKVMVAGMLDIPGFDQKRRVYDPKGISPCLNGLGNGGLLEPKILVAGHLECDSGGTGKVYDPEGVAPTQLAQHGNAITKVIVAGNVNPSGNGMNGQVFDAEGLAPTLTTNKGEGNKILIKELDNHGQRTGVMTLTRQFNGKYGVGDDIVGTLQASRVDKVPMVVEPRAVLTPDRPEKRQNDRRMKEPGEPMFTLTAADKHGIAIIDTRQHIDDRVGKGPRVYRDNCPTLNGTDYKEPKKVYDGCRIRKLTPLECFRLQSYPDWWYVKLKLFRHPEYIEQVDMSRNDITVQVLKLIQDNGLKEGMSDSQLYKMAGNGVTSAVAADIARRLI